MTEKLLKIKDVAVALGVSRSHAYHLMSIGKLRYVQIGTAKRVRQLDVDEYIKENLSPNFTKKNSKRYNGSKSLVP